MQAAIWNPHEKSIHIADIAPKAPNPGEVRVRIKAASLNHIEIWLRKGAFGFISEPFVPGADGAGVVEDVGSDEDRHLIGQEVVISPSLNWLDSEMPPPHFFILGTGNHGTFAQYLTIAKDNIYPKPSWLSFEQAAALPMAGVTAYRGLFKRARLKAGDKLLITGIGGGVAQTALQFAVAHGADVYVTSSSDEKIQAAIELGAKGGFNYADEAWPAKAQEHAGQFDVIFDSAGGKCFEQLADLAKTGGQIVSIGMTAGAQASVDIQKLFSKQLSYCGSVMGSIQDFRDMIDFVDQHRIAPPVTKTIALNEVNEGLRALGEAGRSGKTVIRVA